MAMNDNITIPNLCQLIEDSIRTHWNLPSLTDYQGETFSYNDVARKIEKLHIMFENSGLQRGDKIALCGRNSANWAVAFFATLTYGAVAVPLLHEFTADQIHNCVNHSDSKLLFIGDYVKTIIDPGKMPQLEGIINLPDFSLHTCRSEKLEFAREHLNELFGARWPKEFEPENFTCYKEQKPDDLALINYTSGTTGHSKGVMLPYRAMWSNYDFATKVMNPYLHPGDKVISILPLAHMYGMTFELIYEFILGCHTCFLSRVPSPAVILKAFSEIRPRIIISVPLIIEKIVKKKVMPALQTNRMRLLLNTPGIGKKIRDRICEEVKDLFGGNFYEIIIGGAGISQEVESFLHRINFPITIGYGATECAPIICYEDWQRFVPGSCGKCVVHMELNIESPDPYNIPGEILVRGLNVMLGYYKDEELTRESIDADGWFHTGDLGVLDSEGNVFIKGRSKNMLLSANGQNIYPEEIEDKLNSKALVTECVVVQREDKLVGLVYPDFEEARKLGLEDSDLESVMAENLSSLNAELPSYYKLSKIEIRNEEFSKTAKNSIRRYLYS
ncbi:MAG: AMP-binding protein [Prevotellaceae bacterium]|nr:AMP-binding protein [Prevotellaceae bacterium]